MSRRRRPPFGKYHARTQEEADHIKAMLAACPKCRWCKKPVVGGQVDGEGQPSHFLCQLSFLALRKPFRREVPINPRLPQAEYLKRPQTSVADRATGKEER